MVQDVEVYEKVHIAWLYYMENLTQSEIADRLGLTRLMVHRTLQKCQQEGLVHVVINHPRCTTKLSARSWSRYLD